MVVQRLTGTTPAPIVATELLLVEVELFDLDELRGDVGDHRLELLDFEEEEEEEEEEERWLLLLLLDLESFSFDCVSLSVMSHLLTLSFFLPVFSASLVSSKAFDTAFTKALVTGLPLLLVLELLLLLELFLDPFEDTFADLSFSSSDSLEDSYMLRVATTNKVENLVFRYGKETLVFMYG